MNRIAKSRRPVIALLGLIMAVGISCGGEGVGGPILRADAEFDPVASPDVVSRIAEDSVSIAQTFTVLETGTLERFQIVLTQGDAGSEGLIQIDVRPLNVTGEPEDNDMNSLINPISLTTAELPPVGTDEFTIFELTGEVGREVTAGDQFAIVVTFVSRTAGLANEPIARVLGIAVGGFAGGAGSSDINGPLLAPGFVNNTIDYIFRTFVLQ